MGSHPKPLERAEARRLRSELGLPVKVIARRVGVSVSSVSLWTRDIVILPEHAERNREAAQRLRSAQWVQLNRSRRAAFQSEGRRRARRGDALHQAGCMLYWAEGSKERNTIVFANPDVHMMRFFVSFLRICFQIPDERIRLRLNVYLNNGRTIGEVEEFWLDALALPRDCLRAHSINHFPTSTSGEKKDKLPFGVCTIQVGSTRVLQHIFGAIQEYGGFEEPRWLDGPKRKARLRPGNAAAA